MSVSVFYHPSSVLHDPGPGHPESPARIEAILTHLRTPDFADLVAWHEAAPAGRADIERVHPSDYVDRLELVADQGGGRLDEDTAMNAHSFAAAIHAAGAAIQAAASALDGQPAFAAVRPPGHHATRTVAMGFCLLNNVAVAAYHALDELGLGRVLIVDWDVHHGNGTQDIVESDSRVRYVSMHQWPLYPGSGRAEETGVGNIFNVPRPPGLARETYVEDLDAAVQRAVDGWRPDLILLSAGFDAMAGDPLAGFTLEPPDYCTWVERWRGLGVPIAALLEGGYTPARIATAAGVTIRALA